jgi:sensor c-di-GMP phosphodiesterase-like protein
MHAANRLTAMVIAVVCVMTALPVIAAIVLSRHQAIEHEQVYVLGLARQALVSSEQTAQQVLDGGHVMQRFAGAPCSAAAVDALQRIDLGSTLLQAVGHLDGDVIDCSSIGGDRPFDLGPADLVTTTGARIWTNVRLFDDQKPYLAIARGSFVGIVNKDLPLSFIDPTPGLRASTFNWTHRAPLIGAVDPRWFANVGGDAVFRSGDYTVAVARSKRFDLGSVAAVPLTNTVRYARETALIMVPLGLTAGLLLALLVGNAMRARSSTVGMIRAALRRDEFHLLYQPVVDLATGRTVGAEALIRWRRGDGEIVPPDDFIPEAERGGVIQLITARVLDLLAADVRPVTRLAPDFYFAVNLSAADIHGPKIVSQVKQFVTRTGLKPENLVIEATERSFVDADAASETITTLRQAGVKIAIDDFGTGYSSLGYLARLKIDLIKIDKLFVHAVGTDSVTSPVASRIIDMAKDLGLRLIAEGVETAAQADRLRVLKVEYGQGFHFAPPLTIDELLLHLRSERRQFAAAAPA